MYLHFALRVLLAKLLAQYLGGCFLYLLAIIHADNRRLFFYQLADHILDYILHILAHGKDGAVTHSHIVPLLDGLVINKGIPHGIGHLPCLHAGQFFCHPRRVFLRRAVRHEINQRRNSLRHRLAGNDIDILLLHQRSCLVCGQDNILIVRQDKNIVRVHFLNRVEHILRAGVHRLPSSNNIIHAQPLENLIDPFADRYGDKAHFLVRHFMGFLFLGYPLLPPLLIRQLLLLGSLLGVFN